MSTSSANAANWLDHLEGYKREMEASVGRMEASMGRMEERLGVTTNDAC
jgi:hypothetical protein